MALVCYTRHMTSEKLDQPQKLKKSKLGQENESRRGVIEDLFYDFHRSRAQVYRMNFVRGIFFGFGTVIGGTIIVAILIALLGLLTDIPGGVGDFIQFVVDTVQNSSK